MLGCILRNVKLPTGPEPRVVMEETPVVSQELPTGLRPAWSREQRRVVSREPQDSLSFRSVGPGCRCPWTGMIPMSGSLKMTNRLTFLAFFEVAGRVQAGVNARPEDRGAAEPAELGGVRPVAERAGDEHVEVGVGGFAGGGHQVGAGDGAELGADEVAGTAFGAGLRLTLDVSALGADERRWATG